MKYPLVIFDCDGVLVDSERIHNGVDAEFIAKTGLEMTADECRALFKGKTYDEVAVYVAEKTGRDLKPSWSYDFGLKTAEAFVRELKPIDGVIDVVELLAKNNHSYCVASQGSREKMQLTLSLTKLLPYFEGNIFTSREVPRGKPFPDLFLHAAKTMGYKPSECVVIEDSSTGVKAAVAAEMKVFGYAADENPSSLADAGAEIFTDMKQLPDLLGL